MTTTPSLAWFGPEDRPALQDFWGTWARHAHEIQAATRALLSTDPEFRPHADRLMPEGSGDETPRGLRLAMAGDWAAYESELRQKGQGYAVDGMSFSSWNDLFGALQRRLVPLVLRDFAPELGRAEAVLQVASRFFGRILTVIGEEYLATKERLVSEQRELLVHRANERDESEARYRALFDASPAPMWVYEKIGLTFLAVNDAAVRHYGYSRDEFARMTLRDIRPEGDDKALLEDVATDDPRSQGAVWRHRKKDGRVILVEIRAHDIDFAGMPARLVVANDVTERLAAEQALARTEEQLRQSQKMEAIGLLAGGVAHDFNNMLSVVLSYSKMVAADLGADDPLREDVEEIRKAGERAAALTRQLLAFSRQQVIDARPLELGEVIANLGGMLRRLIGEDVRLETKSASGLSFVKADPSHIEQLVMNLVVNARDAMPKGGRIAIEATNVDLDEAQAQAHLGMKPGPHVRLAVSDTGTGMSKETQSRIFEPFFTTKEKGKGTGLGLSTVFGIVRQLGGSIWVDSELGKGTTFEIYLPATDEEGAPVTADASPQAARGEETLLLLDDEESVREVAARILKRAGYRVLVAGEPQEAMRFAKEHPHPIDLLVSDVVMPSSNGPEVAPGLLAVRPEMRVLFMSGYTGEAVSRHDALGSGEAPFIQKPLTPESLMAKVRAVLSAAA